MSIQKPEGTNSELKYPISPSDLIKAFVAKGYTPTKISTILEGRISFRTIYRWQAKDAKPQRYSDYLTVLTLAQTLGVLPAEESTLDKPNKK